MMNVFVSTHPFGSVSREPLDILARDDIRVELNPYGRKITPAELTEHLADKQGLIAGTEVLDGNVFDRAPKLKIIARVGIGLDNVDFDEVQRRGIVLTYTPDAVSQAVAELAVAQMFNLARSIPAICETVKAGGWKRPIGFELMGKIIGIIGFGRIGQRVARMLRGFSCRVLVNDIAPDHEEASRLGVELTSKEDIYRQADVITLHTPGTPLTRSMIGPAELAAMKPAACLINTARGGIVREDALYTALKNGVIGAAAVDVYETEPYIGPLAELDNVLLTAHSASCSQEARCQMELGAAREIVQFVDGRPQISPVPPAVVRAERSESSSTVNLEWRDVFNRTPTRAGREYQDYRSHWRQYPTHKIVGEAPLNLDIELVHNPIEPFADAGLEDYFQSPRRDDATLMPADLFDRILDEFASLPGPTAIKLGVRGCALDHPEFPRFLARIAEVGCVETISAVNLSHLPDVDGALFEAMVRHRLDVLNVYLDAPETDQIPFDALGEIRKRKALAGTAWPALRAVGALPSATPRDIEQLASLWEHWVDVLALSFAEDRARRVRDDRWAPSRLYQRMMISAEGLLLACSFDVRQRFPLGQFPDVSLRQAWRGETMTRLRRILSNLEGRSEKPITSDQLREAMNQENTNFMNKNDFLNNKKR
jgi:D-3-phosphoglycerate dehydrogenase